MAQTRVFNESVFSSYSAYQNFIKGDEAIAQVLSHRKEDRKPAKEQPKLAGKWEVCAWIILPFREVITQFLREVAKCLSLLGFEDKAIKARKAAHSFYKSFDSKPAERVKISFIAKMRNRPNPDGQVVCNHPPVSTPDPRLLKKFINRKNPVNLDQNAGICRGIVSWFFYLYFKTKDRFLDPDLHMRALGEQFTNGGSMEPVLMQSILGGGGKIFNLKIGASDWLTKLFKQKYEPLLEIPVKDCMSTIRTYHLCEFEELPVGAYSLGLPHHAMGFLKVSNDLSYFIEPNLGIYAIRGKEQEKAFFSMLLIVLKALREDFKTRQDHTFLERDIVFLPVASRA